MKAKNKIITAILLSAGATVGTALINKYIKMSAISRNLLAQPEPRCCRWRLGNIYYTKNGTGKPLLLVHDLTHASSSSDSTFKRALYCLHHRSFRLRTFREAKFNLHKFSLCAVVKRFCKIRDWTPHKHSCYRCVRSYRDNGLRIQSGSF